MERFSHIPEKFGNYKNFLKRLETIDQKIQHAYLEGENQPPDGKKSIQKRILDATRGTPQQRIEKKQDEWIAVTGQLYPFVSDKDGKPAYLSSFLKESGLTSSIYTDFYHIPEDKIIPNYSCYEAECTMSRDCYIAENAANKLNLLMPKNANIWIHRCHTGPYRVADTGISLDTYQNGGEINLGTNLWNYKDIGTVITALQLGLEYKGCSHIFLCNIGSEETASVDTLRGYDGLCLKATLSPKHIFAVLTVKDGKIVDACSREEFLRQGRQRESLEISAEETGLAKKYRSRHLPSDKVLLPRKPRYPSPSNDEVLSGTVMTQSHTKPKSKRLHI